MQKIRKNCVRTFNKSPHSTSEIELSQFFQLTLSQLTKRAKLKVVFPETMIYTKSLPLTYDYFKTHLPSVLKTKCFNPNHLPFDEEIKDTEIAHLFEHALLDMLCAKKISQGKKTACFRGHTEWNWRKTAKGTFNINLSVKQQDAELLQQILPAAVKLIDDLFIESNFLPITTRQALIAPAPHSFQSAS